MTLLELKGDEAAAHAQLTARGAEVLADFILSLAGEAGPVGDHIRTFIAAESVAKTVESLESQIQGLKSPSDYEHRHALGRDIGTRLSFIVDSVERLVLPQDPQGAFNVLVTLFEADAIAMEQCGEHTWSVTCAYARAVEVMTHAVRGLPRDVILDKLNSLVDADAYGVRVDLKSVILALRVDGENVDA